MRKNNFQATGQILKTKNRAFRLLPLGLILIICFTVNCFADEINFDVTVDRSRVSLGKSIQLSLNFYGTRDISAVDLPDIEGFDWQYVGPSTRMSVVNGQVSSSITHTYLLTPLEEGHFTIPALSIEYQGNTYTSRPIDVEVIQGPVNPVVPSGPASGQREQYLTSEELKDRVFLIMEIDKRRLFLNEVVPVTFKLYVNRLGIRDIQYPEFSHEGFNLGEFAKPKQYQENLAGILYEVIEFNTEVFPTRTGQLKLGPGELKCNLIVKKQSRSRPFSLFDDDFGSFFGSDIFEDFFGSYETYPLVLKSMEVLIESLPLPEQGRPENFKGAVGDFNFYLQASPHELKVGDPITLKLRITGEGNFNTVQQPSLNLGEDFKIYDPQVNQNGNSKTFELAVIPKSEKVNQLGPVNFSFFNPQTEKYQNITRGPISLEVKPLPEGQKMKIMEFSEIEKKQAQQETIGKDIIYIKEHPGSLKPQDRYFYQSPVFAVLVVLPLLIILAGSVYGAKKRQLETDIGYARRLGAARKAKQNLARAQGFLKSSQVDKFYDAVFKTLQEYLGDRFHLASAGITSNVVQEQLKPRNINPQILEKIKTCFSHCDIARYASGSITKERMQESFNLMKEIIDSLEKVRT